MIPFAIIVAATILFFVLERVIPGRQLPEASGWYARAAFLNICQVSIVLLTGIAWNRWMQRWSLFHISSSMPAMAQGFLGWFIGTFVFYWWHRVRHDVDILWRVFHQVHHSPSRIELLTSFYKHPVEILADSILSSAIMFIFLGASPMAGAWFNVFAVLGEYFYHSNLRTPHCLVTSFKDRNITRSITNWIFTPSTTEISLGGTGCLAPFETLMNSPPNAVFQTATKAN